MADFDLHSSCFWHYRVLDSVALNRCEGVETAVVSRNFVAVNMAPHVDDRLRKLADASSAPILAVHVEPTEDMIAERGRASFDSEELAIELNGSRALLEKK